MVCADVADIDQMADERHQNRFGEPEGNSNPVA
jgi:hypothetical protein